MKKLALLIAAVLIVFSLHAQTPQFWGTAFYGGADSAGTLFTVKADGSGFRVLHEFTDSTGTNPAGKLLMARDGNFYGTTLFGGPGNAGVLFRFNPATSVYAVVHDFDSTSQGQPGKTLIQLSNGKIYGMTQYGGTNRFNGTIYYYDPDSNLFTILHNFDGIDGSQPLGGLMQASDGKLYGMTSEGGLYGENGYYGGFGVLFSIDTINYTFTKLVDFSGPYDSSAYGNAPFANLIQLSNGKLYGTTSEGGRFTLGVIFSYDITTAKDSTLFAYLGIENPNGSLVQAPNGLVFCTAESDQSNNTGSLDYFDTATFQQDGQGLLKDVGTNPYGSMIVGSDGNLYGTMSEGGLYGYGVIFSLNPVTYRYQDIYDLTFSRGTNPRGDLIEYDMAATSVEPTADADYKLSIYPNPSTGSFTINSSQNMKEVKVTNLLGQPVYDAKPDQQDYSFELNTAGLYFITITSNTEVTTQKIIVTK